jgi:hypothetical protein
MKQDSPGMQAIRSQPPMIAQYPDNVRSNRIQSLLEPNTILAPGLLGSAHKLSLRSSPMPPSRSEPTPSHDETAAAAALVERFLVASMVPDPETAATLMAPDVAITFTGGRKFKHPRDSTGFNAMRYKWVKKKMERTDVAPGIGETIVYNTGTLYGEWPDGTPFEGNRYVDRFVVCDGRIVKMDVWNDSAEWLLTRHGIEA